ncbi:MAG: dihydroorotase family protein [Spirochaetales bacterium]|nr:dihydroorotase family protein [Spirochaetales bacterium]
MIIRNADIFGKVSDILISGELIIQIAAAGALSGRLAGEHEMDAGGRTVLPGLIDPHVHLRCPGMEMKEDWATGARAALAGGVTTVIDMPNTKPATETASALDLKRAAASKTDAAGYPLGRLFWVGCSPDTLGELPGLLGEMDVAGVKLFFSESSGNNSSSDRAFVKAVFGAAADAGKPAAVHTELAELLELSAGVGLPELAMHGLRRPQSAAEAGTALVLELAAETGCIAYLCHMSTAAEFEMVRSHKARYGAESVIAELSPHHLLLNENHQVIGGPQSWAKVNPPLRTAGDNCAALRALLDGTVDLIGSDHAPHLLSEKDGRNAGGFHGCPSGFPGLETELGAVAGFLKEQSAEWRDLVSMLTNHNPARIFGLEDRCGIAEGKRADLVILDGPKIVDSGNFKTKAAYSPFNGMELQVSVYKTILRGKIIEQ